MSKPLTPLATVEAYFASLATGDFARLGSLLADDIVWHQPGQGALSKSYRGKDEVFALFGKFMEISGGTFKIHAVDSVMANRDVVAATLAFSASNARGQISMKGVDVMRVENGLIKEVHLFSSDQAAEDAFWV